MVLRQIRRPWVVCAPTRSSQQRSQVVTKCLLNSIRRSHQIEVFQQSTPNLMNRLQQHQRMRGRHQVKGQKVVSTYRTFTASTSNRKQEVNMKRINSKALQTYNTHIIPFWYLFSRFLQYLLLSHIPKTCNINLSNALFTRLCHYNQFIVLKVIFSSALPFQQCPPLGLHHGVSKITLSQLSGKENNAD